MAFFETMRLRDKDNNIISPGEEGSLTLLRRIFQLLKPLGIVTGNGSNRLNIDVNAITTLPTLANVTTVATVTGVTTVSTVTGVTTVGTVTNQAQMGTIPAFDLMRAMSRNAYSTGPRAKLVIT